MWFVYALCSGLSAALLAIVINVGLKHADALVMTSFVCLIMTVILFIACFVTKKFDWFSFNTLGAKEWVSLVVAGFIAGVGYLTYFLALKYGPISYVVAIDRLSILYIVIISYFFLGAKINLLTFIGSLLILLGTFLISYI